MANDGAKDKSTDRPTRVLSESSSRRQFLTGLAAGGAALGTGIVAVPDVAAANTASSERTRAASSRAASASTTTRATGATHQSSRAAEALRIRHEAAALAAEAPPVVHVANGDERSDMTYAFSFTKGLPHDYDTGLVETVEDFEQFINGVESGDVDDFRATRLGPTHGFRTIDGNPSMRAWETQSAGLSYDLVGYDPQALTMPPAPAAGSPELVGEIGEVYAQAVLRDEPLTMLRADAGANATRDRMLAALSELDWFNADVGGRRVSAVARRRRRVRLTSQTAFRGIAPGDSVGPYVSQFLLVGSPGPGATSGQIEYGAQSIDQRVTYVRPQDFMTSWDEWFDVQCALDSRGREQTAGNRRFITTGRDLATYVHADALYQPYLNACLLMLSHGIPFDNGLPYQGDDRRDHQQGFVLFDTPHVLTMLVEVCGRALKTVAYQKFNVHRRLRPEALAGRLEMAEVIGVAELSAMAESIDTTAIGDDVRRMTANASGIATMLLPMAFSEGSPMHPAYGAGHGTVAGACTTILKALFDHTRDVAATGDASLAYVATRDGSSLATVNVLDSAGRPARLTVEGELNKLAANIAIGRDWAGVHYFSDYWESLLLGEQIALQILREHKLTLREDFEITVPLFDGTTIKL